MYPALTLGKILKEKTNANVVLGGSLINLTKEAYIHHKDMFGIYFGKYLVDKGVISEAQYNELLDNVNA